MIDDGKRQNLNFLRLEQAFWELPKPRTILRPCTFQAPFKTIFNLCVWGFNV